MLRSAHLFIKRTALSFLCVICSFSFIYSQEVDSISMEQSGDLIKVHYKILNSNSNQIFRVSVLCSINGGLKSQLNSLSGDFGENIIGGRSDYLILWDVLKDVEELTSAEFFIKAELVRDLSEQPYDKSPESKIKGKFYLLPGIEVPGPKGGLRIGYMGSFGISIQFNYGKIPVMDEYAKSSYYTGFGPNASLAIDLTKRIINMNDLQMHLMAGFRQTDLIVYNTSGSLPQFWRQGMDGMGMGIIFGIRRMAIDMSVSHFFPQQLEIKLDEPVVLASPNNMFDINLGVKF